MHVLVTGGTGFVGTYLCEEVAGRGHEVTALARNPREADFEADVRIVRGDVTDYDSIADAFEGVEVVVNLVALSPLFKPPGGDEQHLEVHLGGTENAVEAAEKQGVEKFVQMSGLGADPNGTTHFIRAKGKAESVVEASSLDWVIVRPSVIFGDGGEFVPFTRKLAPPYLTPLPGGGKTRFQPIWVGDIVPMLGDAVEGTVTGPHASEGDEGGEHGGESGSDNDENEGEDPHVGRTYEIGGPDVLTLAEVARLAWAAENKPVSVVSMPMSLARVGLSFLDAIPGAPMGMDQYRSLQFDNVTTENDIGAFGYERSDLRTLGDYLGVSDRA